MDLEYSKNLKLDMNPASVPPVVRVKQGDGFARFIQVTLTRDGVTYIPETGITYVFRCEKPDGTAVITDSESVDTELQRKLINVNTTTGVITIEVIDQVDAVAGRCKCDLCLIKSEKALSTIPFIIEVIASPNVANRAISTDDFRTLDNLIAETETVLGRVDEAVEAAEEAVEAAETAVEAAEEASQTASEAAETADIAAAKLTGLSADAVGLAPNADPSVQISGGTVDEHGVVTPYSLLFGIPRSETPIPTQVYSYQNSNNGTTHPTGGTWTPAPNPVKGQYLWRKTVTTWTLNNTVITTTEEYDVSYIGTDGSGAVTSVNTKTGAVVLDASDIKTANNKSIETVLAGFEFKSLGTV